MMSLIEMTPTTFSPRHTGAPPMCFADRSSAASRRVVSGSTVTTCFVMISETFNMGHRLVVRVIAVLETEESRKQRARAAADADPASALIEKRTQRGQTGHSRDDSPAAEGASPR